VGRRHGRALVAAVERDRQDARLWSFPNGTLGPDDSVKGFEVETRDGSAGHVSWAS